VSLKIFSPLVYIINFINLCHQFCFFFLAIHSGLELIPLILGVVTTSVSSGQAVSRTDKVAYRTLCMIGASLITIGAGLITLWNENSGRAAQICFMFITGLGTGRKFNY
jgi:hypothetical protein